MLINTLNGYLILQAGGATTKPAQPASQAAATSLGDQIRSQVRAQVAAARGEAAAAAQGTPAPPAPPATPRTFTIRGPNGEQTVIGMPSNEDIIPPQAVDISLAFFFTVAAIIIGLPLARAFARRMDRKGVNTQIPNELSAQLTQLNQAVDAIALEVERISEGQRFTTRLLSEQRDATRQTLPSGAER
jgi:hypothetical protein